jgi:hypothetical protein
MGGAVNSKQRLHREKIVESIKVHNAMALGMPTQWPNQFVSYSISRFYVLVRTPWWPLLLGTHVQTTTQKNHVSQ